MRRSFRVMPMKRVKSSCAIIVIFYAENYYATDINKQLNFYCAFSKVCIAAHGTSQSVAGTGT